MGEHQLDKLGVTGSSPVPPIEKPCTKGFFVVLAGDSDLVVARTDASGSNHFSGKPRQMAWHRSRASNKSPGNDRSRVARGRKRPSVGKGGESARPPGGLCWGSLVRARSEGPATVALMIVGFTPMKFEERSHPLPSRRAPRHSAPISTGARPSKTRPLVDHRSLPAAKSSSEAS